MGRFLTSLTYILVFWCFAVAYAQDTEMDITLTRLFGSPATPVERKILCT